MNPENQAPKPELSAKHKSNIKNSLYTKKTELEKLEKDLKYVTGKANKAELEDKIIKLEGEIRINEEEGKITRANDRNFEARMSFDQAQISALDDFVKYAKSEKGSDQLKAMGVIYRSIDDGKNDLMAKNSFDSFIKAYRAERKKIIIKQDVTDLDNYVLRYEKAFGLESKPFISEQEKKESSQREASLSHKDSQEFVKNTLVTIRNMEQNLLEAKARAPRKILGGLDTKETQPIEDEIASLKRKLAIAVSSAASDYLGVHINYSDIGA